MKNSHQCLCTVNIHQCISNFNNLSYKARDFQSLGDNQLGMFPHEEGMFRYESDPGEICSYRDIAVNFCLVSITRNCY